MFGYRPPTNTLDETLRKAFRLDGPVDERFASLLERLREEEADAREH